MNFRKLCIDYGVPIAPHAHRHYRAGWVNVACPFCTGNPGYHLGYEESSSGIGFACYRCGGKSGIRTIAALLHIPYEEAKEVISQYGGRPYQIQVKRWRDWKFEKIEPPSGLRRVSVRGLKYLMERGFDVDELERLWDIRMFGPVGRYKFRIYIPIKFQGLTISYTCRSYVGSDVRYLSCPSAEEKIPHKQILYGIDEVPSRNRVVVVEGCTDVWRLGPGAVATFGTKVTQSQLKLLSAFKKIVLVRDSDTAGRVAWGKLKAQLEGFGLDVIAHTLDSGVEDAASLPQSEANYLMRTL